MVVNRSVRVDGGVAFVTTKIDLEYARAKIKANVLIGPNGCWEWQAARVQGYGTISINRVFFRAHRLSVLAFTGVDPGRSFVLHSCDNPGCCNPDHLSIGSHRDNVADQVRRKRTSTGSKNGNSKLTDAQVLAIRMDQGTLHNELARRYGTSQANITLIRKGRGWKHVAMPDSMHVRPNRGVKLTPEQVREIKSNLHLSNLALGKRYGVDKSCISRIRSGKNWKHIDAPSIPASPASLTGSKHG